MSFDVSRIADPTFFAENRTPAHSDHRWFADAAEAARGTSSFEQCLNGTWAFHYAENPDAAPAGFFEPGFDRSGWAEIAVPGRTRWTVFDPDAATFYINIADPAVIVVIDSRQPDRIAHMFAAPAAGPHGLDLDTATRRLFCACDANTLATLDARSGKILGTQPLSGTPDVIFFNRHRRELYVAVGDPGVIDVFSTSPMKRLATIKTEAGAHTTALSPAGDRLYAFLPRTHRAAIYAT